jgi:hypothetical protein
LYNVVNVRLIWVFLKLLLPKFSSGLYGGFRPFTIRPAYRYASFSEVLEDLPRGPTSTVVAASFTTMFIDVGSAVPSHLRDEAIRNAMSDVCEVIHDFAVDRPDLRVSAVL